MRWHDVDDDEDVDTFKLPPEPSRRSDRVSKKPALYEGLTDAYFKTEEKEEEGDDHNRVSSRPQRVHSSPRLTYADEYQQDVPQRRRTTVKPDERRMTVHMPNLPAIVTAASTTVDDIPNAGLMQPPAQPPLRAKNVGGTSRSPAHPCPYCTKNTLVRAKCRTTGFYYLHKHWCNGVERDMVRVG